MSTFLEEKSGRGRKLKIKSPKPLRDSEPLTLKMVFLFLYFSFELLTEFGFKLHLQFLDIFPGLTLRLCSSQISYFSKFFILRVKLRIIISLNTGFNPWIKEKEEQI